MATGYRVVADITLPAALPRGTAITTYMEAPDEEFGRWAMGVQFVPHLCDPALFVGEPLNPCVERIFNVAAEAQIGYDAVVNFDPFIFRGEIHCSTLSTDPQDLQDQIGRMSSLERSLFLAAQVERAAFTPTNPSLRSSAAGAGDILNSTANSPLDTLAIVEEALSRKLRGGRGMVHMTPRVFTYLVAGAAVKRDGPNFVTPLGHYVVADPGYTGISPVSGTVVATESWIYGSGPVLFKEGPEFSFGRPDQNMILTRNVAVAPVERTMIAAFVPCTVVAAKATVVAVTVV